MTAERDLDLVLAGWVRASDAGKVPMPAVRAALEEVERTPQRLRRHVGPFSVPVPARRVGRRAPGLVLAVLLLGVAVIALALGTGAVNRLLKPPLPSSSAPPRSPDPTADISASDRQVVFPSLGIRVSVPATWREIGGPPGVIVLAASDGTTASIYHGDPRTFSICDPVCESIDIPFRLPFDRARVRTDAMASLRSRATADSAASVRWDVVQDLTTWVVQPERLVVSHQPGSGQDAYVVASYIDELIVIAVSTPVDRDAGTLVDGLLRTLRPYPAFASSVGKPVVQANASVGIVVEVPDVWRADGTTPAPGVVTFGDGRVAVSTANPDGSINVCDPTCHAVLPTDLGSLERSTFARSDRTIQTGDVEVGHAPGRFQVSEGFVPSYRAIGFVGGKPVHIWVGLGEDVDRSVAEAIVASFQFLAAPARMRGDDLAGDGWALPFDPAWRNYNISVSAGNAAGQYWMCTISGFSTTAVHCAITQAATLDAMVTATGYQSDRTDGVLDGEPAVILRIEGYEYPARGAQWVALILAVHDGRPFFIRIQSGRSRGLPVDEVLRAFRFTD